MFMIEEKSMPRVATKTARKSVDLTTIVNHNHTETDEQINTRIAERFDVLDELSRHATTGVIQAMIASGSPGVGKSHTVIKQLEEYDPEGDTWTVVKGYTRPTGIVKLLYQYRHPGNVIVFDDADSVFNDDTSLNLLKAVCDSSDRRRVSWLSEGKLIDEDTAEIVPRNFDFEGSIIFLTNLDFDYLIARGHKLAPHLEALTSRAHYLDLTLKTNRDRLVRIQQVVEQGLLNYLEVDEQVDVLTFLEVHADRMRELSLRAVIKLGNLRKANGNWEKIAKITMLKG